MAGATQGLSWRGVRSPTTITSPERWRLEPLVPAHLKRSTEAPKQGGAPIRAGRPGLRLLNDPQGFWGPDLNHRMLIRSGDDA